VDNNPVIFVDPLGLYLAAVDGTDSEYCVSERLKAASGERFKSGHFEAERLIAEAGSDGEQLRDESTQNEPATVNHHVMAARVVLPADRAGAATAPGNGFQICPAA
jgi:hypothetical protein